MREGVRRRPRIVAVDRDIADIAELLDALLAGVIGAGRQKFIRSRKRRAVGMNLRSVGQDRRARRLRQSGIILAVPRCACGFDPGKAVEQHAVAALLG